MRRQYHSRVVEGRTLIWDIHRLVAVTREYPVHEVPVLQIAELDESYCFEGEAATCRAVALHAQLIQETDLAYPIVLSASGRVMDGMHRVCKALLAHRVTIAAVQFKEDPPPDYIDADIESLPYDD